MKLLRYAVRASLLGLAWLAGCSFSWLPSGGGGPAYGVTQPMYGINPPPHDSSIMIQDFSYTPAHPIRVGDTLLFSATTNKPAEGCQLIVRIDSRDDLVTFLRDDGLPPDDVANDGVWCNQRVWNAQNGSDLEDLPVTVSLSWWDTGTVQELSATPLTVLPEEGGQ